jgi:hypothetical protein
VSQEEFYVPPEATKDPNKEAFEEESAQTKSSVTAQPASKPSESVKKSTPEPPTTIGLRGLCSVTEHHYAVVVNGEIGYCSEDLEEVKRVINHVLSRMCGDISVQDIFVFQRMKLEFGANLY